VLAREDFLPMAAVLDEHMQRREFLVGDSATVADFVTAYTLDWAFTGRPKAYRVVPRGPRGDPPD